MSAVALQVNGRAIAAEVEPRQHLGDFVRETLLLTGTHLGCEHGVCGACTVLIDGAPARACIAYTAALDGAAVTTIEGLADDPVMVDLRDAFSREHGLQCGFCTPGMLIMARDIVMRRPDADEPTIRHELAGNLCRCTGYVGIVRAIRAVAAARAGEPPVVTRGRSVTTPAGRSPLAFPATPPWLAALPPSAAAGQTEASGGSAIAPLRNPVIFSQAFEVPAPRPDVWTLLIDPARVVACLPGARLTAPSRGGAIEAAMTVRLGPLRADFGGTGRLATDPATWSGTLDGAGRDGRSATRVQARLAFRLDELRGGAATSVTVEAAYALQGPLAQMSRGALARDLVERLTQTFAANLSAGLAGAAPTGGGPSLNAGSLALALLKGWLVRLYRRG